MFSRLIQCQTGHAHTGKYYRHFVPTEETSCPCGAVLQTQQHVTLECKTHEWHRHVLGHSRHSQWGRLTGMIKGINKLISFIKRSNPFDKPATRRDTTPNKRIRRREGAGWKDRDQRA